MSEDTQESGTRQILRRAARDLKVRSEALQRVQASAGEELAEAGPIIRVIDELLNPLRTLEPGCAEPGPAPAARPATIPGGTGRNPRKAFTDKIVSMLHGTPGRTAEGIANHFGRSLDPYLRGVLDQAVRERRLEHNEGLYTAVEGELG